MSEVEERLERLEKRVDELLGDSLYITCPECGDKAVRVGDQWWCEGYCRKGWVRRRMYVEVGR